VQAAVGPAIEARYDAGAERVLAVVHKGVIKAIAARLLERPIASFAEWSPALGSVHRMRWDRAWSLDDLEISA
jgi:broad specificity phosphatase PhoE